MEVSLKRRGIKDPFGFNKAINWDKLEDPEVLKELEKATSSKPQASSNKLDTVGFYGKKIVESEE